MASEICKGESIKMSSGAVLAVIQFLAVWLFLFVLQCQSPSEHNRKREYAFRSNLIFTYPKWVVLLLFFNYRLIRFPLPLLIAQTVNYGFLAYFFIAQHVGRMAPEPAGVFPLIKVWGIVFLALGFIMIADDAVYHIRFGKK